MRSLVSSVRGFVSTLLLQEYAGQVHKRFLIGGSGGCIMSFTALAAGGETLPMLTITFSTLYMFFLGAGGYAARDHRRLAMVLRLLAITSLVSAIVLLVVACGKYGAHAESIPH